MAYPEFPLNPPIEASGATSGQSHLDWLTDEVVPMLHTMHLMADHIWPGDGVIGLWPTPYPGLLVHKQSSPTMKIEVDPGLCKMDTGIYGLRLKFTSITLIPPASDDRIDIVEVSPETGKLLITQGVADASPSAPSTTSGYFKIAEIYHRTGESSIKDSDDATNGYITDKRTYANA